MGTLVRQKDYWNRESEAERLAARTEEGGRGREDGPARVDPAPRDEDGEAWRSCRTGP